MIAAKLFVSRCFPLVMGGNCVILTRNSSDRLIAGARFLEYDESQTEMGVMSISPDIPA